jgi:hypothetical protein
MTYDIYRKPTSTDLIIHNDSCHPHEHKRSAINFLVNRMKKYPITHGSRDREKRTIITILHRNLYKQQDMYPKHRRNTNQERKQKDRWATFTYCGSEVRTVTKLFKNTNISIAYKTNNTIKNHLKPMLPKNRYIYQLKCNNCALKYIGQTGHTFKTQYNEHINAFRTNKPKIRRSHTRQRAYL